MNVKRLMTVFGTRPEAIKMAPILRAMESHADLFESLVTVTGQHREMLDQVLKVFSIKPDYDLEIMEEGQTIASIISKCLQGLESVFYREHPDMVLVQGDTSTVLAASLAAYHHQIPVGHVEAGLRTYDKYRPFPEEMNRRLVSHVADIHFAPTARAMDHLVAEGIPRHTIYLTGNTVIDALLEVAKRPYDLRKLKLPGVADSKRFVLVTVHRRESFGPPMRTICGAIRELAIRHGDQFNFVLPVHRNPQVREVVQEILGDVPHVGLMDPMEYEPFVHLMKAAYFVITDSGGIQEESPSLHKPVLVVREKTERPEALEAGVVQLVGVDKDRIVERAEALMLNPEVYQAMSQGANPYGDGFAAERILGSLLHYFGFTDKRPEEFNPSKKIS